MYGLPLVYYADGNPPPQDILNDLKKAGYKMDESNIIALTPNQISDLKAIISGVSLPFIYFPVENKTNCKYQKSSHKQQSQNIKS